MSDERGENQAVLLNMEHNMFLYTQHFCTNFFFFTTANAEDVLS